LETLVHAAYECRFETEGLAVTPGQYDAGLKELCAALDRAQRERTEVALSGAADLLNLGHLNQDILLLQVSTKLHQHLAQPIAPLDLSRRVLKALLAVVRDKLQSRADLARSNDRKRSQKNPRRVLTELLYQRWKTLSGQDPKVSGAECSKISPFMLTLGFYSSSPMGWARTSRIRL